MRYSTRIVIFLLFLNAGATAAVQAGVAADWGIQPSPGGGEEIEQANQSASEIRGSGGLGDTLFGLFTAVATTFESIFSVVFAGPAMIANLGVPSWLTTFIFAPMYLIVAVDFVYLLTQRRA